MAPQTIPESDLLTPVDTTVADDPRSWPTLELIDVDVLGDDGHRVSLLGLSDGRTRTLVGQLEPLLADQAHLLKLRSLRQAPYIQIATVTRYDSGLDNDSELSLRAAGQAGWYSLQPSEAYQAMWHEIELAVRMFYWITDAHKQRLTAKKRKSIRPYQNWPVEQLFEDYGLEYFGRSKMAPEAAQRIFKHKEFLLECMVSGKADVEWCETPLYLHLAKKFPKQLQAAMARSSRTEAMKNHNALPIRSSASTLKRKREQNGKEKPANEQSQHLDLAAESKPTALPQYRRQNVLPKSEQYFTTPKTDHVLDRRRFAMKGRSALRPSAVKPAPDSASQESTDTSTDSEKEDAISDDLDDTTEVLFANKRKQSETDIARDGAAHLGQSSSADEQSGSEREQPAQGSPAKLYTADPLQTSREDEPSSQMEVWHCSFNGCPHKISAASQPDLQMLTEEHVALHAYDNDARVRLVQQLEHASLPVSHLMERVRYRARAEQQAGTPSSY